MGVQIYVLDRASKDLGEVVVYLGEQRRKWAWRNGKAGCSSGGLYGGAHIGRLKSKTRAAAHLRA